MFNQKVSSADYISPKLSSRWKVFLKLDFLAHIFVVTLNWRSSLYCKFFGAFVAWQYASVLNMVRG